MDDVSRLQDSDMDWLGGTQGFGKRSRHGLAHSDKRRRRGLGGHVTALIRSEVVLLYSLGLHAVEVHFALPNITFGLSRIVTAHNAAQNRIHHPKFTHAVEVRAVTLGVEMDRVDSKTIA